MPRRENAPSRLLAASELVARWSDRHGIAAAGELGLADRERWASIVGDDLARAGDPIRLDSGTLVIEANDEAGELRLKYAREGLRVTLNEVLGAEIVRRIVVRRGRYF